MEMADITIHLEPVINEQEIARLQSALNDLGEGDELNIVMEAADAHQADRVTEILEAGGFDYQPRGSHDGRLYQITARRKTK
ncbi:MAG: hypothetical protein PWP72_130 [Thermoanaerobacter sp.]|jgi:hypothetical protein|uniref:hypothetical protein n=1 Tax=Desulfofundulus thermocisternus TaxID=42471 RepID=UPI00068BDEF5|nr:hypothetical protein [Desulfofundulus thermocisternus]MDK2887253.1 hypothetical protein [Thermoanaerobacter sp.]